MSQYNNISVAYIAGIVQDSLVDGPGLRTVVFFSGCSVACPQCHNVKFWKRDAGVLMDVSQLAEKVRACSTTGKVTLSGGEPLEQFDAVMALIEALPGFEFGLYTSNELDEVNPDLLSRLEFVKTGRYERDKKIENQYFGSSNQQLIMLR